MKTVLIIIGMIVSLSAFSQPYYIYQEFSGVEHPDFAELSDTSFSISASDKILYLCLDPQLLETGDTIKVVGRQKKVDGIALTGMNLLTGHRAVTIGTGMGFIDNVTVTIIGKGRVFITKP